VDYADIYTEAYYRGAGVDPLLDYVYELENPEKTVRRYEWNGILKIVQSLFPNPITSKIRWLDYGCGNGGLVRYVREMTDCEIFGYDEGWIVEKAIEYGVPVTRQKEQIGDAKYDIVTAIEVLEHIENPLATLEEIRNFLTPGGLFFFTTGNAQAHRANLLAWNYFSPEIHISLYEPSTMKFALTKTGFQPFFPLTPPAGWSDVIRFKILKNIGVRQINGLEKIIPWKWIAPIIDHSMKISAHPLGWVARG
jgi:SAM-dependent methyltransferase